MHHHSKLKLNKMSTKNLTEKESLMLQEIISNYDEDDNLCFTRQLTQEEKGVIGSLVKKGLVYDSFEGMTEEGYNKHNFFPSGL